MIPTIFVVDDEEDIRDILKINLEREGYAVSCHASATDAWRALEPHVPEKILSRVKAVLRRASRQTEAPPHPCSRSSTRGSSFPPTGLNLNP